MRARGPRGTHGLVQMVREQVAVLTDSTDKLVIAVNGLQHNVKALGRMVTTLAERVDDHEDRITKLEKKP